MAFHETPVARSKEFAIKLTLTPGAFYHNCIFQTFWQFSTWKWAKLALIYLKRQLQHDIHQHHVLGHFCSDMRISFFSFLSISDSFAAMIKILLGLFRVLKKIFAMSNFYHGVAKCTAGDFAVSSSLKFLSIFVHIPASSEPITLIWVSLERSSFLLQNLSIDDANFGQR